MFKTSFLFFIIFGATEIKAQDILFLNNGTEIMAKIIEIDDKTISYKKFENISGLTYTIPLNEAFMVIYKNGLKETFVTNKKVIEDRDKNKKEESIPLLVLSNSNFEVKLISTENIPDKRNKNICVNAVIDIYNKNSFFDQIKLTAIQDVTAKLDYSKIDRNYYKNSYIYISSKKFLNFFYQKYENYTGKGDGWALPPDFFAADKYCSVAFLNQNGFNKEQNFRGGIKVAAKISLQDCSSIESKLLSIALVWLDVNFIVSD